MALQKHQMFRHILQSRWFTVALVLVIGFFLMSLIKIEPALVAVNRELNNLDVKITEIEKSSSELERLGDYLKSNAYLERQARLKLNYKKPDEKVVYVYTKENSGFAEPKAFEDRDNATESRLIQHLKMWWEYLTE